jgi:hypothetical protein
LDGIAANAAYGFDRLADICSSDPIGAAVVNESENRTVKTPNARKKPDNVQSSEAQPQVTCPFGA